ncbi:MAG: FkbM family methyltransferase [Burkholderiaceae bacterium]
MSLYYSDLEPLVRQSGRTSITRDGFTFSLDLDFRHERVYAAKLLLDVRQPQCDIDELLIRRFVQVGDRVLDGGAHIGFTAWQMFTAGATEVVAVEPVPSIFSRLQNLRTSGFFAVNAAIDAQAGSGTLILSTSHNQGSSLDASMLAIFPSVFGEQPRSIKVDLTTIDQLVSQFGALDVWKLDIEGSEGRAMRGAQHSLKHCPPRVIFAELYDPFRDEFAALAEPTHPHAYRAFIDRHRYELTLLPFRTPHTEDFHITSPMYVFTREALC